MKFKGKMLSVMLASLLAAALVGCGASKESNTDNTAEKPDTTIKAEAGEDVQVTEEPIEDEKTDDSDGKQSADDQKDNSSEFTDENGDQIVVDTVTSNADDSDADNAWEYFNVKDGNVSLKGELGEIPKDKAQDAVNELYAIKGYKFKEEPYKSKYPNGTIADMNKIQFTEEEQSILNKLEAYEKN